LRSAELQAALSNCLSCKACTSECPSNVNMSLLKAELLQARIRRDGLPLRERVLSSADLLGKLGCLMPRLANAALDSLLVRSFLAKTLGVAWQRPLPHYARQRFDRWFAGRPAPPSKAPRGRVVLWDDTFVRYHEPQIGMAAVKVLEAAGFEVALPLGRNVAGGPPSARAISRKRRGLASTTSPCSTRMSIPPRFSFWNRPATRCSWRITAS